jgi:5-oxoprolinase (ATP-hydrolysing)
MSTMEQLRADGRADGKVAFDPVSLEIMWSRLINISEECWLTIRRTAFSLIIGEVQDFGCELLDAKGNSLAHSPRSMPVFNLALPLTVKALLREFPGESLEPGDVLITNDPWLCAGHLFDVALVTPAFRGGKLVGLVASVAHCSDIGGTRDSLSVREIYEEGLQIPPMKLYRAGKPNDDLLRILAKNVRKPEMVMGDLQAQYSANEVGVRRLLAFMEEYGLVDLEELASVVQGRAEEAMRAAIRAIPDGTYSHTTEFDSVGLPLSFTAHVTIEDDELQVSWEAPPQVEQGAINSTMNYTASHTAYALKCLLTPDIPSNAGCFAPIRTIAPEGSVLNCTYPAGVNVRTNTGWFVAPALFGALAQVLPQRVQAFTGLPLIVGAYGRQGGETYNDFLFQGGGQGASAHGDGKSGLLYPTSAGNTSVEMFEVRTPLLVEEKEYLADSGGAGRNRGGLGQRVRLRKLEDDGHPAQLSMISYNMEHPVPGLFGGRPGSLPQVAITRSGEKVEGVELRGIGELRAAEDTAVVELPGGSGYGDPRERPLEQVQADLDGGYLSEAGLAAYGCRLGVGGTVVRHDEGD